MKVKVKQTAPSWKVFKKKSFDIYVSVWKGEYDVGVGVFIIHYQKTDGFFFFFFFQLSPFHILMFHTRYLKKCRQWWREILKACPLKLSNHFSSLCPPSADGQMDKQAVLSSLTSLSSQEEQRGAERSRQEADLSNRITDGRCLGQSIATARRLLTLGFPLDLMECSKSIHGPDGLFPSPVLFFIRGAFKCPFGRSSPAHGWSFALWASTCCYYCCLAVNWFSDSPSSKLWPHWHSFHFLLNYLSRVPALLETPEFSSRSRSSLCCVAACSRLISFSMPLNEAKMKLLSVE